jgi:hypothetical protein
MQRDFTPRIALTLFCIVLLSLGQFSGMSLSAESNCQRRSIRARARNLWGSELFVAGVGHHHKSTFILGRQHRCGIAAEL